MIFIAGDWEQDITHFAKAKEHLIDTQKHHQIYGTAEIINSAEVLATMPFLSYEQQIDVLIQLLSMCDTIYMLKGWEKNNDVSLLHDYASAKNYRIIYSKKF